MAVSADQTKSWRFLTENSKASAVQLVMFWKINLPKLKNLLNLNHLERPDGLLCECRLISRPGVGYAGILESGFTGELVCDTTY